MLKDMKIKNFMDLLASKSATPGGGSVAALTGAMGAALLSMVGNLTIGKESYQDVEDEVKILLRKSETLRAALEELVEQDIEVFNQLMAVMKLPKTNEEEKENRKKQIQTALVDAAKVPLDIAHKCIDVIGVCQKMAERGNKNAISDVGVGVILAVAAFESAIINVRINLKSIKDEVIKTEIREEINNLIAISKEEKERVLETVFQKL